MKRIVTKIVGAGLFGDQTRARHRRLTRGTEVTLVRDAGNQYDPAAVMVMVSTLEGPRPVGYLPSIVAGGIAKRMDRGQRYKARVIIGFASGRVPQVQIDPIKGKS